MPNPAASAQAPTGTFDPRNRKTLLITAFFAYPRTDGSFTAFRDYPWLMIVPDERKAAGYPNLEELQQWCVASTGQLGHFAPFTPTTPETHLEALQWVFEDNTRCTSRLENIPAT